MSSPDDDWRSKVEQSYRNREVREVAKILSSLEPNSTFASKLRLAMQFENNIFASATSLVDYRKRLQKRLKKLQKSYKPEKEDPSQEKQNAAEKQKQLVAQYGDMLRFIVKHSSEALRNVRNMKEKGGPKKAQQLQVHTENAKQWAADLGILGSSTKKAISMDDLNKLEKLMSTRVDNIRSHVVKLADPDSFLKETMEKLEPQLMNSPALADSIRKLSNNNNEPLPDDDELLPLLQESVQILQRPIPPRLDLEEEALLQLEKLRAASLASFRLLALRDTKNAPENVLVKCHNEAIQATRRLQEITSAQQSKSSNDEKQKVELQDAWNKVMEYPNESDNDNLPKIPIKSRVLLTPGSKPRFSNLLPELKRKGAKLVKPSNVGSHQNYYLVLEFGTAFSMTIHLVPLLVEIQPLESSNHSVYDVSDHSNRYLTRVTQEKLRYASTRATAVLRQCFLQSNNNSSSYTSDIEIEISEATALLQFIQIARSTFDNESAVSAA